ncbi:hypothetical protein L9G15_21135, partial [Shewanella sp. A3A]|nr:hypothetical protein [Shewanella ferrihydritica]
AVYDGIGKELCNVALGSTVGSDDVDGCFPEIANGLRSFPEQLNGRVKLLQSLLRAREGA